METYIGKTMNGVFLIISGITLLILAFICEDKGTLDSGVLLIIMGMAVKI